MEQQIPWLNPASFRGRINLPANFDLTVFTPYLTDIQETVLPGLLGPARLAQLIGWVRMYPYGVVPVPEEWPEDGSLVDAPTLDELPLTPTQQLFKLVQAYIVYSVYAEFVMKGDVQNTDVGIVRKALDSSEVLSDAQRTQLYRNYQALADTRARLIADFVAADRAACTAPVASTGPRFSSSRGRTKSVFD